MREHRRISKAYTALVRAWIGTERFKSLKDAKIICLESDKAKTTRGKTVYAACERVQSKNQWAIPAEIAIVFYEPNMRLLERDQMIAVAYHELLHIGFDGADDYHILPHDVEDFKEMLDVFGVHWIEGVIKPESLALLSEIYRSIEDQIAREEVLGEIARRNAELGAFREV